ncbi:MAG: hypothetical protein QXI09_02375 [Candidatus Aenigmatarchaeota archaeon]
MLLIKNFLFSLFFTLAIFLFFVAGFTRKSNIFYYSILFGTILLLLSFQVV